MSGSRDTNYFVNFNGGFSGFNNPGGRVFWVAASGYTALNGIGPSDSNSGLSPQKPFSTIQKGLDSCVAGRGDIVAVLPGTYTLTAALTMTLADVTLCSAHPVGPQQYSPVIITAAATYDLNVIQIDADNCRVQGLGFECGFTAVTASQEIIQVNSTNTTTDIFGVVIENCFFDFTRAAGAASAADTDLDGIRIGLDTNDRAYNTTVRGCTIRGCDEIAISISAGSQGALIENNHIYDGVGSELTSQGVDVLAIGARIINNKIMVGTSSDTVACVNCGIAAGLTQIHNNNLVARGADTVGITVINTATMFSSGNWINAVSAGNIVDFKTASTSPSSSADIANVYASDPALAALTAATVAGT